MGTLRAIDRNGEIEEANKADMNYIWSGTESMTSTVKSGDYRSITIKLNSV